MKSIFRCFLIFVACVCFAEEDFTDDIDPKESNEINHLNLDATPTERAKDLDEHLNLDATPIEGTNDTAVASDRWNNGWDGELLVHCKWGGSGGWKTVSSIYSVHDNRREDRLFDVKCHDSPVGRGYPSNCKFSGWLNNWDQPIRYTCPNNGKVIGLHSYHHNHHEDRRWEIACCEVPKDRRPTYCKWTGWQNPWDGVLNYKVPNGWILSGMHSIHDNGREDRLYEFYICQIPRCEITHAYISGSVRSHYVGEKAVGILVRSNLSGRDIETTFSSNEKVTESTSISQMKTFNFEFSASFTVTAGGEWLGGSLSETVGYSISQGWSTTRTKTKTIAQEIGVSDKLYVSPRHIGIFAIKAKEYVYEATRVPVRYTIKCGSRTTYKWDYVNIKRNEYKAFDAYFNDLTCKGSCTDQLVCASNVDKQDIMKLITKVHADFEKCKKL